MYYKCLVFINYIASKIPLILKIKSNILNLKEIGLDKFRASVFDRTKDGSTLMHIAALNGHPETAMVILLS